MKGRREAEAYPSNSGQINKSLQQVSLPLIWLICLIVLYLFGEKILYNMRYNRVTLKISTINSMKNMQNSEVWHDMCLCAGMLSLSLKVWIPRQFLVWLVLPGAETCDLFSVRYFLAKYITTRSVSWTWIIMANNLMMFLYVWKHPFWTETSRKEHKHIMYLSYNEPGAVRRKRQKRRRISMILIVFFIVL